MTDRELFDNPHVKWTTFLVMAVVGRGEGRGEEGVDGWGTSEVSPTLQLPCRALTSDAFSVVNFLNKNLSFLWAEIIAWTISSQLLVLSMHHSLLDGIVGHDKLFLRIPSKLLWTKWFYFTKTSSNHGNPTYRTCQYCETFIISVIVTLSTSSIALVSMHSQKYLGCGNSWQKPKRHLAHLWTRKDEPHISSTWFY